MSDSKKKIVRCPACGGPSVYSAENPYRPFCSRRCKLQDLGAWASESYRVGASVAEDSGAEDATPPSAGHKLN